MEDPRVTKCLTAKRESRAVEFKEQFDPTDNRQALEVLKDIVAICNAGGGTLAIGIDNAGKVCGSDVQPVLGYDHAKYCDLIKKYTMQNFADFELIEAKKDGHAVAIFLINPPDSPLIFAPALDRATRIGRGGLAVGRDRLGSERNQSAHAEAPQARHSPDSSRATVPA